MLCKQLFSRTLPQKVFHAVQRPAFTYLFTFMTHSQTDSLASCWSICSALLIYINILHTCFNPYTEEAIRLITSHLWFCCDRERGFAFIDASAFAQLMLTSTALTCCIHTLYTTVQKTIVLYSKLFYITTVNNNCFLYVFWFFNPLSCLLYLESRMKYEGCMVAIYWNWYLLTRCSSYDVYSRVSKRNKKHPFRLHHHPRPLAKRTLDF